MDWFLYDTDLHHERAKADGSVIIETIQLLCTPNRLTTFRKMSTKAINKFIMNLFFVMPCIFYDTFLR